jgi:hypothetical protein
MVDPSKMPMRDRKIALELAVFDESRLQFAVDDGILGEAFRTALKMRAEDQGIMDVTDEEIRRLYPVALEACVEIHGEIEQEERCSDS